MSNQSADARLPTLSGISLSNSLDNSVSNSTIYNNFLDHSSASSKQETYSDHGKFSSLDTPMPDVSPPNNFLNMNYHNNEHFGLCSSNDVMSLDNTDNNTLNIDNDICNTFDKENITCEGESLYLNQSNPSATKSNIDEALDECKVLCTEQHKTKKVLIHANNFSLVVDPSHLTYTNK